jgi:nucleotide-binding universal stress UspA family protein
MNRFTESPVVVPIDFSDEADQAVAKALQLAATSADVYLIHVGPTLTYFEPVAVYEVLSESSRREAILEMMAKRYADAKYHGVHREVRFGDPGQEIVDYAAKVGAGLIVMSSHGRTGLTHLLIGSVAERVVRLAKCPVLVLRS